jgi:hypothetical protein
MQAWEANETNCSITLRILRRSQSNITPKTNASKTGIASEGGSLMFMLNQQISKRSMGSLLNYRGITAERDGYA